MNTKQITDRFGRATFQAEIPPPPDTTINQLTQRASGSLRLRDRFRYARRAIVVAVVALACLFAGLLGNSQALVLIGCLGLPLALYLLLRISPEQIERQAALTEGDCERAVSQYDSQCNAAAARFALATRAAIQRENELAIESGSSMAEIAEFKSEVDNAFRAIEVESTKQLAECQPRVKACRDEVQRKRSQLAAVCRKQKAKLIPAPARRAGVELISSIAALSRARIEESAAKAEVHAFKMVVEAADRLPQAQPAGEPTEAGNVTELPVWLGTPLPSRRTLEAEAKSLVDANLKTIRARLVKEKNTTSPDQIVQEEIDRLFEGRLPGPNTIEDCVSQLNGEARNWADRLVKEGSPLARTNPPPDKTRHKKAFLLTAAASDSSAYRNLHEALPDHLTALVARDHPATELLYLPVEECCSYAEFPEITNLLGELRALPPEEFDALATVCDPQCLREFFPERTDQDCSPAPLLAGALIFGIIRRDSAQNYSYSGEIIAKGWRAVMDALKDNHLATPIADKVMRQVSAEGLDSAVAKLTEGKQRAASIVPKEFASEFCEALDEAIAHYRRRALVNR